MLTAREHDTLDIVRALGPLIRDHAEEAERDRRVAAPVVQAMTAAGLFRLLTPRSLGGAELDPITFARTIETVAQIDSAAAWALCNPNSIAWWCARLPDAGVEEIYAAGPEPIIAAAFHPPVEASAVPDGYRISGRRPLASGIHDASWVMLTAMVLEDGRPRRRDGAPEVIAAFMPIAQVEIIDTWHTLGMRGTDSNDVEVRDVFVPYSRTYPLVPHSRRGSHFQSALYRLSTMAEVSIVTVPVFLGIARQAVDRVRELAEAKTPFGSTKVLRDRTGAQANIAKAEALLRSGRLLFHHTVGEDWRRAQDGDSHSLTDKADALLAAVHAVECAVKAVDIVFSLAGTTGVYTRNQLERHFRDVHTLRHHGFVAEGRYETVGQVYLGVQPEFGLVAF